VAGFAVAAVGLFTAYLWQSRTQPTNSDGASNALQAWDMLHGNLLLRGWRVSDVSFYTTELPQYMLVEAVRGLGSDVVHVCAAMSYTLLVLLAAWLAKGHAKGAEGVVRALIAAGIMLAPQLGDATFTLLGSPDHVGTGVPLLVTWLVIDRFSFSPGGRPSISPGGRPPGDPPIQGAGPLIPPGGHEAPRLLRFLPRVLVPVLVGVLLAWTAVGDLVAEVVGAVPLAAVCGMRAYQGLVQHREPLRARAYELSLVAAAVLSVAAAAAATKLIATHGGWKATSVPTTFANGTMLRSNSGLTFHGILELFGADFSGQQPGRAVLFAGVHVSGVVLVACGFWLALRRFFRAELLVQVLTVAIAVNLAAYAFGVQVQDIRSTREIAVVLPFGAVLAGRLLGERVVTGRLLQARLVRATAAVLGGAVLAGYCAMLGFNASQPAVPAENADVTTWLAAHGLTRGLAGYWQANSMTLDSGNAIQVRAISATAQKPTTAEHWEAKKAWYDPASSYANFLVTARSPNFESDPVLTWGLTAKAGRPTRVYEFGRYTIAVWDKNLLALLG
jgi:hypothetical protein